MKGHKNMGYKEQLTLVSFMLKMRELRGECKDSHQTCDKLSHETGGGFYSSSQFLEIQDRLRETTEINPPSELSGIGQFSEVVSFLLKYSSRKQ